MVTTGRPPPGFHARRSSTAPLHMQEPRNRGSRRIRLLGDHLRAASTTAFGSSESRRSRRLPRLRCRSARFRGRHRRRGPRRYRVRSHRVCDRHPLVRSRVTCVRHRRHRAGHQRRSSELLRSAIDTWRSRVARACTSSTLDTTRSRVWARRRQVLGKNAEYWRRAAVLHDGARGPAASALSAIYRGRSAATDVITRSITRFIPIWGMRPRSYSD